MPAAKEEPNTGWVHYSFRHGETLLVIASCDLEHIAGKLGAYAVGGDLGAHAPVHEDAELALIFDFYEFLGAIGGVGYVKLHPDVGSYVKMLGSLKRTVMAVVSQTVSRKRKSAV